MRILSFRKDGYRGLATQNAGGRFFDLTERHADYPGPLERHLSHGASQRARLVDQLLAGECIHADAVEILPPLAAPGKIICVGLNYRDHAAESQMKAPDYPTLFARFASSLIGGGAPIVRPLDSVKLDYEGELVAVIGKPGRRIEKSRALDHVAGYSIFNDASIRDFQLQTPQWTMGKNFDGTGAFGPVFVTADELPAGARGLKIETRLNGAVMQRASTDDLIFDVATLVSFISLGITLSPGDIIVTGTPSGVGAARKPPVFMKAADVCEVEIEGIGVLTNHVADETAFA